MSERNLAREIIRGPRTELETRIEDCKDSKAIQELLLAERAGETPMAVIRSASGEVTYVPLVNAQPAAESTQEAPEQARLTPEQLAAISRAQDAADIQQICRGGRELWRHLPMQSAEPQKSATKQKQFLGVDENGFLIPNPDLW
jgi:hypothetical protein